MCERADEIAAAPSHENPDRSVRHHSLIWGIQKRIQCIAHQITEEIVDSLEKFGIGDHQSSNGQTRNPDMLQEGTHKAVYPESGCVSHHDRLVHHYSPGSSVANEFL
jgi:hypothetical protein